MPLDPMPIVDDPGTCDTGTVWNTTFQRDFEAKINAALANLVATNLTVTGATSLQGSVVTYAWIVPPAFSGDLNNYNPAGLETCYGLYLQPSAASAMTGLAAATQGRQLLLLNWSPYTLTIYHEHPGSTDIHRFACPGLTNVVMPAYSHRRLTHFAGRWYLV
jgi:hypothetical protein